MSEELLQEEFYFKAEQDEGRIDKFLTNQLEGISRSKIQLLIAEELVLVNDEVIKSNYKVEAGDEIFVTIPEPEPIDIVAENIPIDILYEDKDIAIVNKEQGMVVHPGAGNPNGTMVNALMYHINDLSGINGEIRPGIVHRLDKDTSGALVIAKNDEAHVHLSEQLQDRSMKRTYWTIVHGSIPHENGTIDAPIGRDPKNRQKFTVINTGKDSVTHFKVIERFNKFTLVEVSLETGRTHQIRVHMNYINFPVAGDETYGPKKTLDGAGQFLHARSLELTHPISGERMKFEAEIPDLFKQTLQELRMKK